MKITIRIPLVVSADGKWYAHGSSSGAVSHEGLIQHWHGDRRYWIDAEVETPDPPHEPLTVKGDASPGGES